MNRRDAILSFIALGAAAGPLAALAQQPEKVRRIGYLVMAPLTETPSPERSALLEGLRALGYVEGRNLAIEYRSAEMEADFLPQLATELVKSGVELIFAVESNVVIAAMKATPSLPIVFVSIADPVELKFAQSLGRPGKNVTGITLLGVNLAPKRLEMLRELLPSAKRIAVLRGSAGTGTSGEWAAIMPAAAKLGFKLELFPVRDAASFPHQLQAIARAKPDALCVLTDSRTIAARRIIADFAVANRLPSVMGFSGYPAAGGLMSLAPNITEQFGRAAAYVDKILKGARPSELAIEQPSTFDLVINLKTAKALGIAVPQSQLIRATRVID
jgi:putative ABC transport system substrate-binding protein